MDRKLGAATAALVSLTLFFCASLLRSSTSEGGPALPSDRLWPGERAQNERDSLQRAALSPEIERFQCYRCHDIERMPSTVPGRSCVKCHQQFLDGSLDKHFPRSDLSKFRQHIHQLVHVPALFGIKERLKRGWFEEFLENPHKLRPGISARMPRLPLNREDIRAVADFFYGPSAGAEETAPREPGSASVGRDLYMKGDCSSCHHFTGVIAEAERRSPRNDRAAILAPDLRFTKARMTGLMIERWLLDPHAINPHSLMPQQKLPEAERRDLAAFIVSSEQRAAAVNPRFEPLPLLDRPVLHSEVEARVFKKVCWHCHSDPKPVRGDGGPGNTGGFGYSGAGLDLSTRDGILRGVSRKD